MACFDVLIVGAGHAGAQAAIALRQRQYLGTIGLLSDELDPPYERPPLSKDYMAGGKTFERLLIRPTSFWPERGVDLRLGRRVVRVDARAREVTTADGESIGYGSLIWAAGGRARRLTCTGHDLTGVHSIRSRVDVDALVTELPATRRVCVVGGGYIGLEAAAVLVKAGKQVTVIEALDRVLARVAGAFLSRAFEAEHRAQGVDLRLQTSVVCVEEADGHATGVRLSTGETIPCEMVIVGIGIAPSVEPLLEAGAQGGNGVEVDGLCRTSLIGVYAIGDCAAHANIFAGGAMLRLESVQNANDMAVTVAKAVTGLEESYQAVPWFWSHQYSLRLQTVGLPNGFDLEVVRGDHSSGSFSVVYTKAGRVVALDCVNSARDYVQGRALVRSRAKVAAERLSDITLNLKDLCW